MVAGVVDEAGSRIVVVVKAATEVVDATVVVLDGAGSGAAVHAASPTRRPTRDLRIARQVMSSFSL